MPPRSSPLRVISELSEVTQDALDRVTRELPPGPPVRCVPVDVLQGDLTQPPGALHFPSVAACAQELIEGVQVEPL